MLSDVQEDNMLAVEQTSIAPEGSNDCKTIGVSTNSEVCTVSVVASAAETAVAPVSELISESEMKADGAEKVMEADGKDDAKETTEETPVAIAIDSVSEVEEKANMVREITDVDGEETAEDATVKPATDGKIDSNCSNEVRTVAQATVVESPLIYDEGIDAPAIAANTDSNCSSNCEIGADAPAIALDCDSESSSLEDVAGTDKVVDDAPAIAPDSDSDSSSQEDGARTASASACASASASAYAPPSASESKPELRFESSSRSGENRCEEEIGLLEHFEIASSTEGNSFSGNTDDAELISNADIVREIISNAVKPQPPDFLDRMWEKVAQAAEQGSDAIDAKALILGRNLERGMDFLAASSEAVDLAATAYVQQGEEFVVERSKSFSESVHQTGTSESAQRSLDFVKTKTEVPMQNVSKTIGFAGDRSEAACSAAYDMAETTFGKMETKIEAVCTSVSDKADKMEAKLEAVCTSVSDKAQRKLDVAVEKAEIARKSTWSTARNLFKGTVVFRPPARAFGSRGA